VKLSLFTLLFSLACLSAGQVYAEEAPVNDPAATSADTDLAAGGVAIEGERMQIYLGRKLKSIGNASLVTDKEHIYGDRIEYDMQNQELHVIGDARIEYEGNTLWGPELRYSLEDNTGEMKNASFRMNSQFTGMPQTGLINATDALNKDYRDPNTLFDTANQQLGSTNIEGESNLNKQLGASRGDAETILFEGQNKKRLKGARYTTCEADSDDWYIKAGEIEIDDYTKTATATNARVEFMGVPFLYTPWMSFSFLNQRKSGFLAPTVGSTSRSGFEVLTPYYWNIAPNMDATLAPRYLSKRGIQYQGEYRYMGENFSGSDSLEYLRDSETDQNRYYTRLTHEHSFGNGWSANYNLEKVSDDQYFSELSTRIVVTSRVNLPQQGQVNYSGENWTFNGLVQKYQTLDDQSFPYERLPQLTLNGNEDFGPTNVNLYSQWVSFDRDEKAFDRILQQVDNDIQLQTNVTGSRATLYPSISLPLARPYGYFTPKFGVHYTKYDLDDPAYTLNGVSGQYNSATRTLPIFSVDSGLYFDRDMRVVKNTYTQTLEPRLYYVYVPYKDQSNLPVFDSALADLNMSTLFLENQFTGNDRINDANQLSLAVTTRLIDSKTGIQRLQATLGQRFYFSEQKVVLPGYNPRDGDRSDIIGAVTARLRNDWNVDGFWQYNTDRSRAIRTNVGARYNPEPGKTLNLSYRYTEERLDQVDLSGQWPLSPGWYGVGRWNYSFRENQPIEGIAGVEYNAGCWQARGVLQRVSTATADANYAFFIQLELGGLASIGSNPLSLLSRSIPGYTSSSLISPNNPQYR
jgi:LPS-assembly protein